MQIRFNSYYALVRPEMGAVHALITSASEASPPSRAAGENFEYYEARNANF